MTKLEKLRKKPYRDAFTKAHLVQGLAFQIKELRLSHNLTQEQLAKALELGSQSAVARLEDPGYGRMSLQTLLKVASYFDVALLTKFVSYSKLIQETEDLSPEAIAPKPFNDEFSETSISTDLSSLKSFFNSVIDLTAAQISKNTTSNKNSVDRWLGHHDRSIDCLLEGSNAYLNEQIAGTKEYNAS
ncbi:MULTISPECIES: helix-turn-helix transcriptional regulator [Burkholderia cepacia complex]|uniref:helix-turn-helix transcriptional regulator n=1 Tax=Burkholderia cepacia complex TaxID=87882 RepID=UPI002AB5B74E|nr:helix-turn-helix transcriptional regulator [Burkholderia cenocepacia]HEM7889458.1 helix-turn-helix transcriptional regulator [Burkholderia cepacia]HEM8509895.1 helix-turn-helix transcriptional regulator [Burkholderia cepacia]